MQGKNAMTHRTVCLETASDECCTPSYLPETDNMVDQLVEELRCVISRHYFLHLIMKHLVHGVCAVCTLPLRTLSCNKNV
jgi:hypothetical protein